MADSSATRCAGLRPKERLVGLAGEDSSQPWLSAPVSAALLVVLLTFLHKPLAGVLPGGSFAMLLGLVVVSTAWWIDRSSARPLGIGGVEIAMILYTLWNAYSMFAPHKYESINPLLGTQESVPRFIMTGTVFPFAMYVAGRYTFERVAAVRALLWLMLALAAYSAAMAIMQFNGPTSLVWPRYIVDGSLPEDETWTDRAIGIFNQPVVNGATMVLGFAFAMLLASRYATHRRWLRLPMGVIAIAIACGYGIFLTHTRVAWLGALLMLLLGAFYAKGFRSGFVAALVLVGAVVGLNWSSFTSSDREAGGIGSKNEVYDRLNGIKTSLWAFEQEPIVGWGVGRFSAVNTYHHQQWSPETPWRSGYGIVSHTNELGILAELGIVGLALWLAVLVLLAHRLWTAFRIMPADSFVGRPLVLMAIIAFAVQICVGFTVDLRFFAFPTYGIFLLIGAVVGFSDRQRRSGSSGAIPEPGESRTW
ncbi:O-antigen ligase family protein [Mycolicibacterium gilvum]|uniref:O-antigen ligase family protein n=1 Tax=Mycolicibacterium gilvum TaxID=1804 RepID=UPI004045D4B8